MIKKSSALAPALAVCIFLFCADSHAQNERDSIRIKQVEIVTVERIKALSQLNLAVPMQQLRGPALRQMNSLSVSDALRYFSGIQLKDYGGVGGLKTINVRSVGTHHTGVFYNGLQIENAQNGQVDLGRFSLSNLEEITLFKGQNTAELLPAKAYASASGIYLKTLEPQFRDSSVFHQMYELKTGSFGSVNPSLAFDYKLGPATTVRLNAAVGNAHGKYKYNISNGVYDTTVVRSNGDIFYNRAELSFFHLPSPQKKFQAHIYHYASERGLPGAVVANKYDFSQRMWDRNYFAQAQFEHRFSDQYKYNIQAKFSEDFTRYIDPDYKMLNGYLDNRFNQQTYYLSTAHQYQFSERIKMGLSIDHMLQRLSANLYNFAEPNRRQWLVALSAAHHTERLKLDANFLVSLIGDRVATQKKSISRKSYTPTVTLNWQPFEDVSYRFLYKSSMRLPTFNESYYTYSGNSVLEPEQAHQFNTGLSWRREVREGIIKSFQVDADAYFNNISNKIVAIPSLNLFRWTMMNLDKVHVRGLGVDVEVNGIWSKFLLQAKINYNMEKAIDRTPNSSVFGSQIPYIPENSGSARLNASYKEWGLQYGFVYAGYRYSQKANIIENYLPPWFTHDLSVHRTLRVAQSTYKLGVEMNNLTNRQYEVISNYPMPGSNFRISLQANIK